ncbi:MAG: DinB family protein [Planctomycetaceae bacterium]
MASRTPNELLIRILDEAFDRAGWHGPTLLNALRGVSAADAVWRPAPERHSIWELALHTAYWKYVVRRRLIGAPRGSFPRKPSNFPALPESPDDAAWAADVALLREEHQRLREAITTFPPLALDTKPAKSKWTNAAHIYGVAAHDVYHAGQIQLLKRLRTAKASR